MLLAEVNRINQLSILFTAKNRNTNKYQRILQSAVPFICYQSHEPILLTFFIWIRILWKPDNETMIHNTYPNCRASGIIYYRCLLLLARKSDIISLAVHQPNWKLVPGSQQLLIIIYQHHHLLHSAYGYQKLKVVYKLKASKFHLILPVE